MPKTTPNAASLPTAHKTLYLHGLDSFLIDSKREVLERHTRHLIAPTTDYRAQPTVVNDFLSQYAGEGIALVIGSSLGGLIAYYLSWFWQIPALVFNPALPYRHEIEALPALPVDTPRQKWLRVILGRHDDTINFQETLNLLYQDMPEQEPFSIHLRNDLAHQIPVPIFEKEISYFYSHFDNVY